MTSARWDFSSMADDRLHDLASLVLYYLPDLSAEQIRKEVHQRRESAASFAELTPDANAVQEGLLLEVDLLLDEELRSEFEAALPVWIVAEMDQWREIAKRPYPLLVEEVDDGESLCCDSCGDLLVGRYVTMGDPLGGLGNGAPTFCAPCVLAAAQAAADSSMRL